MRTTAIGASGLKVPAIGFGTSALGDMPDTYGYAVDEERARATVRAILARPDGFIDSSRNYGMGRSEERVGQVVRELGGWPEGRVLSTKLDRDMETNLLDGTQAWRSLEASLKALGRDRVEILHLHDPEYASDLRDVTGPDGALAALMRMKEQGLATAVGLAAGRIDVMMPLMRDWDLDAIITHNRYTLVNRNAEPMIELAEARGIAVLNAAPYGSGALAKGLAVYGRYAYQDGRPETAAVARIEEICARHGVAPGAAALQFSLRDDRIAATICGVSKPERVAQTLDWAEAPIPEAVWRELMAVEFGTDDPEATRDYKPG
ncbi:aldo/keto reductase [Amaricoccus sp.]|uniref:aldo/keto reductase n=1 Tax=Amaricoccus sp. TaxID=1872485 RepID=UPI0025BD0F47|nr:aldo/keto reductase [Amaricoccus sp.]